MKTFIKVLKKVLCGAGTILAVILTVLASLICFSIEWMFNTWSNLTMDELLFHLTAPLEGTNEGMIKEYFSLCVAPTVLLLLFMLILFCAWRGKKKYYAVICAGIVVSLAVTGTTVRSAWNNLDVGEYVEAQKTDSDFIEANYVNPADVEITFPEKKRNLIYIFLESMEITYADKENGGGFDENTIVELTRIAQENEDFSGNQSYLNGGYSMPGSTWTMAGMFAQTSGLPLDISISGNDMDTQNSFFPGVLTLGDILEDAGYSQTLLIGSDAVFGGRKLYFTEHGNYDICDYYYAVEKGQIPADYRVWWGYEDKRLFKFAKERAMELAEQNEPFNLTILTVDTHFEDGYPCELCQDTFGDNVYANVMACSSNQVDEFIKWLQQQEFYENTTVVLMGDHPTMDSNFCENVDEDYVRRVYTAYINPVIEAQTETERSYTTLDSFPTTLAALGIEIENDRLGLGTNLFSKTQTLTERFGIDTVRKELSKKSEFMIKLANIDKNTKDLMIREGRLPVADVSVDAYQYETGSLPVSVTNIRNMQNDIASVMLAVWTNEDQSDLQWIEMGEIEEECYYINVNVSNFNYKEGEYYIQGYVVDSLGEQYQIGEAVGIVN
ncbi:MAG: LTA synthase family protein [Lachnospiraceae bacterium]